MDGAAKRKWATPMRYLNKTDDIHPCVVFQKLWRNLLNSDWASWMAVFALFLYLNNRKQIKFDFNKAEVNQ